MTAYLTDSQRRITRALRELTDDAGYPPSIREIAETVGLSASTVIYADEARTVQASLFRAPPAAPVLQWALTFGPTT